MKTKIIIKVTLLALVFASTVLSQKVGYTNVELLLSYMPQTQEIEKQLNKFHAKLSQQFETKQYYFQNKYTEYIQLKQKEEQNVSVDKEDLKNRENELMKLEKEIKEMGADSELQLSRKRAQLLEPVQKSIQNAIDEVAKTQGYTYILNNVMGSGVPTILYGTESDDITKAIAQKLGIRIPDSD